MSPWQCPACRIWNEPSANRCDCGFSFLGPKPKRGETPRQQQVHRQVDDLDPDYRNGPEGRRSMWHPNKQQWIAIWVAFFLSLMTWFDAWDGFNRSRRTNHEMAIFLAGGGALLAGLVP